MSPIRAAFALCLLIAPAASAQFTVPATSNIYGAGHAVPPAPGGGGAGTMPILIPLPAGDDLAVRFPSVTGTIDYGPCCPANGPDGVPAAASPPLPVWDGLAGTDFATRSRFFVGVFLDDTEPADPAPERLVFDDGTFESLNPGLRQIFFIGDGLTGEGEGTVQVFHVPAGATRLFLGFQDRQAVDLPGWYGDNSGSLAVSVEVDAATAAGDGVVPTTWGRAKATYE